MDLDLLKWKITVKESLNNTVLNDNRQLSIPLIATKTGLETGTAVLILDLPEKVQINFGNLYYSAKYVTGSETDTVDLNEDITISGSTPNDINVIVEGRCF